MYRVPECKENKELNKQEKDKIFMMVMVQKAIDMDLYQKYSSQVIRLGKAKVDVESPQPLLACFVCFDAMDMQYGL